MKPILCPMIFALFFIQAKIDPVKSIDKQIAQVNADKSLIVKKFDAEKVYNRSFDGGGEIVVYLKKDKPVKIVERVGYSYGKVTTTLYLKQKEVIAITETEEDYVWYNKSTLDLSKLKKVYDTKIYVDQWVSLNSVTTGARVHSDPVAEVTEYRELLEKVEELLGPKKESTE